jgi:hypothetical protein
MLCAIPLQHTIQPARFVSRFSQPGVLVAELGVQVLFCASKVLHVEVQCFQSSMGGFRFVMFRSQQLLVSFLLSGQPSLQLCHPTLQRSGRDNR